MTNAYFLVLQVTANGRAASVAGGDGSGDWKVLLLQHFNRSFSMGATKVGNPTSAANATSNSNAATNAATNAADAASNATADAAADAANADADAATDAVYGCSKLGVSRLKR